MNIPPGTDMKIESHETDMGIDVLTITALNEQAQIDLAMEYTRIVKLLGREWKSEEVIEDEPENGGKDK